MEHNEKSHTTLDIVGVNGTPIRVVKGEQNGEPVAKFFDSRYNFTEYGQFISEYYVETLMGCYSRCGLNLQGGVSNWAINAENLAIVIDWLKSNNVKNLYDRLTEYQRAFLECAIWASMEDYDEDIPMDQNHTIEDIEEQSLNRLLIYCDKFWNDNQELIKKSGLDDGQVGHSLWLSSNGHGAGFFDFSGEECQKLQDLATLHEMNLYVGDDDKVHLDYCEWC